MATPSPPISPDIDGEDILQEYLLADIGITGKELGVGSYSSVLELRYKGMKCAGKKIHRTLYEQGVSAGPEILERFATECDLLSQLRHPHIVQFLGLYFEEEGAEVPILVMEYMPTALTDCVEQYGVMPTEICYSILHDVALGLHYLHDRMPAIIHRDLTANNILLTASMTAKISDLGMAKILNLAPAQMSHRLTVCPGTLSYMPPESLTANPTYDTKLDCFSFGVLIVHIFCGEWPIASEYLQADPRNPGQLYPLTEIERRQKYLRHLGQDHPLLNLIQKCLHNIPSERPGSGIILQELSRAAAHYPPSFANNVEMLQQIRAEVEEREQIKRELVDLHNVFHEKEHEAESARFMHQSETEVLKEKIIRLEQLCSLQEAEIAELQVGNTALQSSLARTQEELAGKQEEIDKRMEQLESLQKRVSRLTRELQKANSLIQKETRESAVKLRQLRTEVTAQSKEREAVVLKLAKGHIKAALVHSVPLHDVSDLSQDFDDFFLSTADEAVETVKKLHTVSHFEAQQLVCDLVQQSYTHCKRAMLDGFRKELEELFTVDHPTVLSFQDRSASSQASNGGSLGAEAMEDLGIAYGMLLRATRLGESKLYETVSKQVYSELMERETFHHASQLVRAQFKNHAELSCKLAWRLLTASPPLIVSKPLDFREDWHDREFQFWDKSPRLHARGFKLLYTRPVLFESYGGKVGVKGWVGNKDTRRTSPSHGRGGGVSSPRAGRTRVGASRPLNS